MQKNEPLMRAIFHRQFFTRTFVLLTLIFCVIVSGLSAQSNNDANDYDSNSFQKLELNFKVLDSNKIKTIIPEINIQKTNVICYRDSFWSDTVRLAYSLKNKNQWISFTTPFHHNVIPWDCKFINLDNKGQPEI